MYKKKPPCVDHCSVTAFSKMFLILTTALVVCAHAGLTCGYGANSSDVHLVDVTFHGHPMEFSNKTIALQSLSKLAGMS